MTDYTTGQVKGVLGSYASMKPDYVGTLFHFRKMDLEQGFKKLPQLFRQVLYLVGVSGQDFQTVGFYMGVTKSTVKAWWDMGVARLCNLMNGVIVE